MTKTQTATNISFFTQTWFQVLLGMISGIGLGLILSPTTAGLLSENISYTLGSWIALPGVLFIGLLKMVVIPLVICSVILGITSSGSTTFLKTIGARLIPYFVLTTAIAITIGMAFIASLIPIGSLRIVLPDKMSSKNRALNGMQGLMQRPSMESRAHQNPLIQERTSIQLPGVLY